ncbi:hypothetical protein H6G17_01080 [Chroococcidiopsis sp. FACHB-1243]|uniref:hypothetical protein n=1 Tax=Chroococcidiopsis sp. [FACHB-1243] TaxID=2692781 RepID=UPI00178023E2|nr:hypothetical protein [Chroococcidiopsis sp. [FACHB-1243]]MBD2304116.1 hypothetical protein [Chroococcidiopsis sp. [FACHB-1243]]
MLPESGARSDRESDRQLRRLGASELCVQVSDYQLPITHYPLPTPYILGNINRK